MKINMTRDEVLLTVGVGVGCAVIGGALGYLYAMKKAREEAAYDSLDAMEQMVDLASERTLGKIEAEREEDMASYEQIIDENHYQNPSPHVISETPEKTSAKELRFYGEVSGAPYPISIDEFRNNDPDYDELLLKWYDVDNVLTTLDEDVADESLFDCIGTHNLGVYGYLDPPEQDSLYVRNEKTRHHYEIIRQNGAYCEMVLGEKYDGPRESSPVDIPVKTE